MNEPTYLSRDQAEADKRLGELILYVSKKCEGDSTFGSIKLNKILWWSDFLAYARYGTPITGSEYRSLEKGPAPKRLVPVRHNLIGAQDAVIQANQVGPTHIQQRVIPLREAELEMFTGREIDLVNQVIRGLWEETAQTVSEWSHGKAWRVTPLGESIPYEAIFLSDEPPTPAEIERTQELAQQYGW